MATTFKPKPKQRGNVILAQDWNTAMGEIERLGVDSLTVSGGTIAGDLMIANGKLGVGTGAAAPTAKLEVNGDIKTDRAVINDGGYGADWAGFSHKDSGTPGNYALLQRKDGTTFLNSASGQNIHFRINNAAKMTLDKDGNLGIGSTAVPNTGGWNRVVDILGPAHARLTVRSTSKNVSTTLYSHSKHGGVGAIGTDSNHALSFFTSAIDRMFITAKGDVTALGNVTAHGNLGIGNTSIPNTGGWDKVVDILGPAHARLTVRSTSKNVSTTFFSHSRYGGHGSIGTDSKHPLWFFTNATERMFITADGDVGIGTQGPTTKLEVNGTVKATQFEGDGSKLTGIATAAASPWTDLPDAAGGKGIQYKAGKTVTIGAANSGANLQIINKVQEANSGDSLVLGKTDAGSPSLKLGYHGSYTWIQSHNKPFAINATGGNVGIGTKDPKSALDVAGYIVMQKPAADTVFALLTSLPNSSLIIAGPNSGSLVFYWKDETGKEYELKLNGTALT